MGKGKNLRPDERKMVIALRKDGKTFLDIAHIMNKSETACKQAWYKFQSSGSYHDCQKSGRPRKTTKHMDRVIHRMSEKDRFCTASTIAAEIKKSYNLNIHQKTISRRLHEFGLKGRRPRKKPMLSKKNIKQRLDFARAHQHWTVQDWSKVLFSDESKFNRICSDGISYVRRRVGEDLDPKCTSKTLKHGGGNVMVWGCFSINGVGPLRPINGIMDRFLYKDILEETMLPYAHECFGENNFIFQQDNDPKHTAKVVKEFFEEKKITLLPWPSQSPDLNPIENLWGIVKREISNSKPSNLKDLYNLVEKTWNNIKIDQCIRLVESMPKRCAKVIQNKGYWTKY